ncbi:MAG: glycosyltransferase family 9 protein [Elusimicrobiota bacterium]|jgi:heptosyltransferase-2|nr:glycosyltransferase family 9 protein [Elusimicrobiota bacterium]
MKNILVSTISFHMGDFIWASSALAAIKKTYPQTKITVIVPKNLKDLAQNNPAIDDVIYSLYSSVGLAFKIKQFLWNLKNILRIFFSHYDACIILAQSRLTILIAKICRIPHIVGMDLCLNRDNPYPLSAHYTDIVKAFHNQSKLHVALRFQNIVKGFLGIYNNASPVLPDPSNFADSAKRFLKTRRKKSIALCISGDKQKRNLSVNEWKISNCAEVIKTLSRKFDASFYVLGTGSDFNKANELAGMRNVYNLCGKTSVGEALYILSQMDLCISVDTGILHLAAAANIPVIALHGHCPPQRTGGMSSKVRAIYHVIECSNRIWEAKDEYFCPYLESPRCMEAITPDEIVSVATEILDEESK